jgi:hypothetical protein
MINLLLKPNLNYFHFHLLLAIFYPTHLEVHLTHLIENLILCEVL